MNHCSVEYAPSLHTFFTTFSLLISFGSGHILQELALTALHGGRQRSCWPLWKNTRTQIIFVWSDFIHEKTNSMLWENGKRTIFSGDTMLEVTQRFPSDGGYGPKHDCTEKGAFGSLFFFFFLDESHSLILCICVIQVRWLCCCPLPSSSTNVWLAVPTPLSGPVWPTLSPSSSFSSSAGPPLRSPTCLSFPSWSPVSTLKWNSLPIGTIYRHSSRVHSEVIYRSWVGSFPLVCAGMRSQCLPTSQSMQWLTCCSTSRQERLTTLHLDPQMSKSSGWERIVIKIHFTI